MTFEPQLLIGVLTGTVIAYAATPVAMRAAQRLEFFDKPAGYKGHAAPTPYLGGSAVVLAFVFAALLAAGHVERTGPVVCGALVLWAVGTADDRVNLSPYLRLGVEFVIAVGLWAFGLGWDLGFGPAVDLAVTVLWIAGVVNAFNLFDNMDGAAGTMACVVAGAVAILGAALGNTWLAVCAGALCGACLGFLPYNLCSPSRIFLGDGGSMPIGFVVAALVMIGASDAVREWQALAMALLLVGIPLLDTCLVVISRRRRGLSVLTGGRDHLTHRTRRRLTTVRAVAVALGTAQALLAVLALAAYRGGSVVLVVIVAAYLLAAALVIEIVDAGFSDESATAVLPEIRRAPTSRRPALAAGLLGLVFGLSSFYDGAYDSSLWAPGGLILLALLLALAIGRPPRLTTPAKLALGALAVLAAWSLASTAWSSSPELGFVDSNRMIVLAATLGVLLLVVSDSRAALWALGGAVAGIVVVGGYSILDMLIGGGAELFKVGRLNGPLGYINAQGAVYVMAAIPLMALAERCRSVALGAVGAGLGSMCLGLALLTQSRGVVLALAVGGIVAFLVAPGRLRRAAAVAVMVLPVAAASPWLLDVLDAATAGTLSTGATRKAAAVLVLAALLAGAGWWMVMRIGSSLSANAALVARRGWQAALLGAATLVVGGAIAKAPQIENRARAEYHVFVDVRSAPESPEATRSRLLSGSSKRYDYWRIAYRAWRERPIAGIGAGGYPVRYYQQRSTIEDVRQAHSLELQVLSDLGVIGFVPLLAFLAAGVWGIVRAARRRPEGVDGGLLVAAAGLYSAWLAQTSVDWLHLIPGVTGVAFVALASLLRGDAARDASPARVVGSPPLRGVRLRQAVLGVAGVCVLAALLSLSRQTLAEHYRTRAQESLAHASPATALELADRSLRLDRDAVSAYYLRSAALEQLGRPQEAHAALATGLAREPENFVTWALMGDLESRLGHPTAAQRAYARASALNPRDVGIAALAAQGA